MKRSSQTIKMSINFLPLAALYIQMESPIGRKSKVPLLHRGTQSHERRESAFTDLEHRLEKLAAGMGQMHEWLAEMQQRIEVQSLREPSTATSHTETDCASFSEFAALFCSEFIEAE